MFVGFFLFLLSLFEQTRKKQERTNSDNNSLVCLFAKHEKKNKQRKKKPAPKQLFGKEETGRKVQTDQCVWWDVGVLINGQAGKWEEETQEENRCGQATSSSNARKTTNPAREDKEKQSPRDPLVHFR